MESDCDFLIPERNFISSEHFIGSGYTFSYKINASKLHAGKNFGKLTFTSNFDKIEVEIQILNKRKKEQSKQAQKMKECKVRLMELYQEYRLKRVATGVWAEETVKLFNQLLDQQEDQLFLLMKAQVYVINHQRAEAEEILDAFKKECDNHRSVVWGYYLYIMSLIEREPAYIDRITREIQVIFREHSDSFLLFWILLFLDERYATNNEEKLNF